MCGALGRNVAARFDAGPRPDSPGGRAADTDSAVERHLVGGECPFYGCIPSKMMLRAAETLAEAKRAQLMAGHIDVLPQWAPVARRISEEATSDWSDGAAVERLEQAGATVIHGSGRLAGPHDVRVDLPDGREVRYTARTGIVLNPGTRPAIPLIEGLADTPYWTNREAVQTRELPQSLIVLGGGSVAVELGQVFARFGVAVTILERGPLLLKDEEPEASVAISEALRADGIRILFDAETVIVRHDTRFTLTLADGSQLETEQLLVATGRVPNLEHLELETVGVPAADIIIGDDLRIGDRLWLVGDVTGMGAFTHVSMHQSAIVRRQILGQRALPVAFHSVPHVTFTDPEVGGVGLTEHAARASGIQLATRTADLGSRGVTHGSAAAGGFVKLVVDTDREVLVGATVVGPAAGEVLSMLTLAVHAEIPIETLQSMIYAYPTFHRAVGAAVAQL
jgi:pyruvate/2-oxoglutarate dehydrogenase complex dihydrolipoamide dehydrogenase (E3) component